MLKRIEIKELRMGMYCSSWVNTKSFVKQEFFVDDQDELEQIINSGIKEVFIDPNKGRDVLSAPMTKKPWFQRRPKKLLTR